MSLSYPLFLKTSIELTCPTLSDGRKGGEICTPYVELTERKVKGKSGERGKGGEREGERDLPADHEQSPLLKKKQEMWLGSFWEFQ